MNWYSPLWHSSLGGGGGRGRHGPRGPPVPYHRFVYPRLVNQHKEPPTGPFESVQ